MKRENSRKWRKAHENPEDISKKHLSELRECQRKLRREVNAEGAGK